MTQLASAMKARTKPNSATPKTSSPKVASLASYRTPQMIPISLSHEHVWSQARQLGGIIYRGRVSVMLSFRVLIQWRLMISSQIMSALEM